MSIVEGGVRREAHHTRVKRYYNELGLTRGDIVTIFVTDQIGQLKGEIGEFQNGKGNQAGVRLYGGPKGDCLIRYGRVRGIMVEREGQEPQCAGDCSERQEQ